MDTQAKRMCVSGTIQTVFVGLFAVLELLAVALK